MTALQRDLLIELACVFQELAKECEKDAAFLQTINGLGDKKVFGSDLLEAASEVFDAPGLLDALILEE